MERHGKAQVLNDFAVVKIDSRSMLQKETKLRSLKEGLIRWVERNYTIPQEPVHNLIGKIDQLIRPIRKRSLLPFVGSALSALFGVATDEDITLQDERIKRLELWAAERGNIMQTVIEGNEENAQNIQNLVQFVNQLNSNLTEDLNIIQKETELNNFLIQVEEEIQAHKDYVEALQRARTGILTPTLISIKKLSQIIEWCTLHKHYKPLVQDVYLYYTLSTVKVTKNHILVLIPFNGNHKFSLHTIHPFPLKVNNTPIIWDEDKVNFALSESKLLIIFLEDSELEKCILINKEEYICNFIQLQQPIDKYPCLQGFLLGSSRLLKNCLYKIYNDSFAVKSISNEIIVYVNETTNAQVTCAGLDKIHPINNLVVFKKDCKLIIPNIVYYVPSIFVHVNLSNEVTNKSFQTKAKSFTLEQLHIKQHQKTVIVNGLITSYKQQVAPYLSVVNICLIVIFALVGIQVIRKLIINKMDKISNLLKNMKGNSN